MNEVFKKYKIIITSTALVVIGIVIFIIFQSLESRANKVASNRQLNRVVVGVSKTGSVSTSTPTGNIYNGLMYVSSTVINNLKQQGLKDLPSIQDIRNHANLYVPEMLDKDNDGLTDIEEKKIKTSIENMDTDDDNLSDFQEVMSYFTDPGNSDTDNDGHNDGEEIRNGYNPCGEGKLPLPDKFLENCLKYKK